MICHDASLPIQSLQSTRSFGRPITELRDLIEAVSDFSCRAAEKLRRQNGVAGQVMVFIRTSPFRKTPQYSRSMVVPLRSPTSDTPALATAAAHALRMIYRPGFVYAKAGVMLLDLAPSSRVQLGVNSSSVQMTRLAPEGFPLVVLGKKLDLSANRKVRRIDFHVQLKQP